MARYTRYPPYRRSFFHDYFPPGVKWLLIANTGVFVSTADRFGIDGAGAADVPDLIDGGNGVPETIGFLLSTQDRNERIVLDSVLISEFDGDDAGTINVKNVPPLIVPLADGLNLLGLPVGQTSGNAIGWAGANSPSATRGFSVDGFNIHVVPEPSSLALVAVGSFGAAGLVLRTRKKTRTVGSQN